LELVVGKTSVVEENCDLLGRPLGLRGKQLINRLMCRVIGPRVVEAEEELSFLVAGEQRQLGDAFVRRSQRRPQNLGVVLADEFDGLAPEEARVVIEAGRDAPLLDSEGENQVSSQAAQALGVVYLVERRGHGEERRAVLGGLDV